MVYGVSYIYYIKKREKAKPSNNKKKRKKKRKKRKEKKAKLSNLYKKIRVALYILLMLKLHKPGKGTTIDGELLDHELSGSY